MGRVLFVIQELVRGGAERQLVAVARRLRARGHEVTICTYRQGGAFEADLEGTSVNLVSLHKSNVKIVSTLVFLGKLRRLVRTLRPDVIYGYMDTGNMPAAVMKLVAPGPRIVFGLRASYVDQRVYHWYSGALAAVTTRLARLADLIIANSRAGASHAISIGYPADRTITIPNGVDTQTFAPDPAGAKRVRAEVGFSPDQKVIGIVARLDPMKGYDVFVAAAEILARRRPDVRFLCVGDWIEPYRSQVLTHVNRSGLGDRLKWIGARDDLAAVYSALDIGTSASLFGEGFSNAVAECMACGVPCVVTRVGDSAEIIGETGAVVPPGQPTALAEAWERLLPRLGPELSRASRHRIIANFGMEALVDATEAALWPTSS